MHNIATDSFGIKPDYQPRSEALTATENINDYWSASHKKRALVSQYYTYQRLEQELRTHPNVKVADIGCGYPVKMAKLKQNDNLEITLLDQPALLPVMQSDFPDYRFIPLDLEQPNPPLRDEKFDIIICADVIEHLMNPDRLLNIIKKLSTPETLTILSTPERDNVRGRHCTRPGNQYHVREWNRTEFRHYLDSRGFVVLESVLAPGKKLSRSEKLLRNIFVWLRPRMDYGCHIVVCRLQPR